MFLVLYMYEISLLLVLPVNRNVWVDIASESRLCFTISFLSITLALYCLIFVSHTILFFAKKNKYLI